MPSLMNSVSRVVTLYRAIMCTTYSRRRSMGGIQNCATMPIPTPAQNPPTAPQPLAIPTMKKMATNLQYYIHRQLHRPPLQLPYHPARALNAPSEERVAHRRHQTPSSSHVHLHLRQQDQDVNMPDDNCSKTLLSLHQLH